MRKLRKQHSPDFKARMVLAALREDRTLNEMAARALGVTKVAIFHYETGVCKPSPTVLRKFVETYNLEGNKSLRRYLGHGDA